MSVRDALRRAPMIGDIPALRLLHVGDGWDLVRTPAQIGFLALTHLRATDAPVGPVLYDGPNRRLYYAIQTTTSDSGWDGLPVRHLSRNSWLVTPGLEVMDDWFGGWCEFPTTTRSLGPLLNHLDRRTRSFRARTGVSPFEVGSIEDALPDPGNLPPNCGRASTPCSPSPSCPHRRASGNACGYWPAPKPTCTPFTRGTLTVYCSA